MGQPTATPVAQPPTAQPIPRQVLRFRLGLASSGVPALPNSVLWLAKDLGFYEAEGLDVTLVEVQGTPSVITAMRTGDVDAGNISTQDVVKLTASQTLDLRAIHSPDARLYFLIAARDEVVSPADLKGRTFGVARIGSVDHSLTNLVLGAKGINPADLRLLAIGAPAVRAQTLVGGRIDATTISIATWVSIRNEKGVKILVNLDDYFAAAPVVDKVNAVTLRALNEKPEQLRRFTAAVMKLSRRLANDKQAWLDALAQRRPDLDPADASDLWDAFKTSWAVNGLMNLSQYQKTADFLYQTDDFKDVSRVQVQDWADTRFADAVLKEIGVDARFDDPGRPIQ